jgi:hypothetical protein
MRTTLIPAIGLSLLAACATKADHRADSASGAMDTASTAMAPANGGTISLADVAGTWHNVSRPASGADTSSTQSTINAKADTTGWTMVVGKTTVPLHVRVDGDSIIASSEPFPSIRRKGTTARTMTTYRMRDGKLVGTTVAHYAVKTADSVLVLNAEATRAP